MNIGKKIKYFRNLKGISARSLAIEIGVDPSQISKIENDVSKPSLDTLYNICTALGITLSDFFSEEKKDIPPDLIELIDEAKDLSPEQLEQLTKFLKIMKGK